jgi:tetratricopeptide (TPR) repeat protein
LKLILNRGLVADPLLHVYVTDANGTVRDSELETGRLLVRAFEVGSGFLVRRSQSAAAVLEASPARRALSRVAHCLDQGDRKAASAGLLSYGAVLERHGEHEAALDVYRAVCRERPTDACAALHAARAARKSGRRAEAESLYRQAGAGCGDAHLARLAALGEALVSDEPLIAVTAVMRAARLAGDCEALGVAREERARLQLAAGRKKEALCDLAAAALRFQGRRDRVRVLHRLAELLSARGDLAAAREALLLALELADERQRAHTVQRLRTVARSMGDQLELRRSRGRGAADIVTIGPVGRLQPSALSRAGRVRRWRSRLPAMTAAT